jgi:hypothetical protein
MATPLQGTYLTAHQMIQEQRKLLRRALAVLDSPPGCAPESDEKLRRDIQSFFDRIKMEREIKQDTTKPKDKP